MSCLHYKLWAHFISPLWFLERSYDRKYLVGLSVSLLSLDAIWSDRHVGRFQRSVLSNSEQKWSQTFDRFQSTCVILDTMRAPFLSQTTNVGHWFIRVNFKIHLTISFLYHSKQNGAQPTEYIEYFVRGAPRWLSC